MATSAYNIILQYEFAVADLYEQGGVKHERGILQRFCIGGCIVHFVDHRRCGLVVLIVNVKNIKHRPICGRCFLCMLR
jgi:hypothetical protein